MRCRTISVGLTCLILAVLVTGAWAAPKYKVLYTFTGGSDGGVPYARLLFDKRGNLYGMTHFGGQAGCYAGLGCGTIFELMPASGGGWTESVLYAFAGGAGGDNPIYGGLISDASGNLYGTTYFGGIFGGVCNPYGCGTAFELAQSSQGWTKSLQYSFTGTSGQQPTSALAFDNAGHLYGTTLLGGQYTLGTMFELVKTGSGTWNEATLHQFTGGNDGSSPAAGLIADAAGNFYGTTSTGGSTNGGTVFELTSNRREVKVLHSFKCGLNKCDFKDGGNPWSGLVFDQHGSLYGATRYGGVHRKGAIYRLMPSKGGGWKESLLYSFKSGTGDGAEPLSLLAFDKFGNLYGTTSRGGTNDEGVVFELMPSAGGRWKEAILYRFTGGSDGAKPQAGFVIDATGNLYGTAALGGQKGCGDAGCGVVFEITP
jgi:uncharacterized repeat protein (TIGR03803 family)